MIYWLYTIYIYIYIYLHMSYWLYTIAVEPKNMALAPPMYPHFGIWWC